MMFKTASDVEDFLACVLDVTLQWKLIWLLMVDENALYNSSTFK